MAGDLKRRAKSPLSRSKLAVVHYRVIESSAGFLPSEAEDLIKIWKQQEWELSPPLPPAVWNCSETNNQKEEKKKKLNMWKHRFLMITSSDLMRPADSCFARGGGGKLQNFLGTPTNKLLWEAGGV